MMSAPLHCAWNAIARTVALPVDASIPNARLLGAQTCIKEFSENLNKIKASSFETAETSCNMAKEFESFLTITLERVGLSAIQVKDLRTQIGRTTAFEKLATQLKGATSICRPMEPVLSASSKPRPI